MLLIFTKFLSFLSHQLCIWRKIRNKKTLAVFQGPDSKIIQSGLIFRVGRVTQTNFLTFENFAVPDF